MNFRYLFLLMVFSLNTSWADFSQSNVWLHPSLPEGGPFIIAITGQWPNDCHPGEQKPVISEYDGESVLIEFETIVEHITCNEVSTSYRVLVDMSDVVGSVQGRFMTLDITVRFGAVELKTGSLLSCALVSPCPIAPGPDINPEAGSYFNAELDKQGLILARQNHRMGVFPLIYDESGSSEWLFGGNGIVEDTFFTELVELTGGQCLGCPPPVGPTVMNTVGKLSMLMDSEGLVQVKVNDGLFISYQPIVFGYGEHHILGTENGTIVSIPDLSGRWAIVKESASSSSRMTDPPSSLLPLVFDVTLGVDATPPPLPVIAPPTPGRVLYTVRDIEDESVAEMSCHYQFEIICYLIIPELNNPVDWFTVRLSSIERIIMSNGAPTLTGLSAGTGTAVRID